MSFSELFQAILNTLLVLAVCTAIAVPSGTWIAIILFRTNVFGRKLAWIAIGSQIAVPLYVFAGGWSAGFGLQGWFTALITQFGIPLQVSAMQTRNSAILAVALVHAFAAIPWVALIISLGLVGINRSQEDQARLDGGLTNIMLRLIIPKLRLWLIAAALWCAAPILTEMVVTNLYQLPTVAEQIYLDASRGSVSPLTYLSASLLCVFLLSVSIYLALRMGPSREAILSRASYFPSQVLELGQWRMITTLVLWTILFVLVGLPTLSLIAKAGWQPHVSPGGVTSYGWSVARLGTTVRESCTLFASEFYWSSLLAVLASSLALTTAGVLYAAGHQRWRMLVSFVSVLAIAMPGPLVGMFVIFLLNRSSPAWVGSLYDATLAAPILAQQFRLLPFAWVLVCAITLGIPRSTWDQVKLDGLRKHQILLRVILTQSGWRWLAAWLLLAVLSVGELSCSILVLPPGITTVSMRLFEMLHFGMRHQDSGLCGILLLLGWCVSLAFWKTLRLR